MESARVNTLLNTYFKGKTSVSEEKELRDYFAGGEVALEFEKYGVLFSAFAKAQQETSPQPIDLQSLEDSHKIVPRWIAAVAVAVVIVLGLYVTIGQEDTLSSSYESEEIAILKTKQALGVMSQMLTQSTTQLEVVEEFDKASSTLFKVK